MRKNRNNNRVNNSAAANAAQSTTSIAGANKPTKTARELYGISIAQAYETIVGKKTDGLKIAVMPTMVYIKAADGNNPALTNSVRKECCVIAGMECWNAESRCYRAWDSSSKRYAISRKKWDAAKAAATKAAKDVPVVAVPIAPAKETEPSAPIADGSFSREQILAIAKRLNKKTTAKMVDDAIASIVGEKVVAEKTIEERIVDGGLDTLCKRANATAADWMNQGGTAAARIMHKASREFREACKAAGIEPVDVSAFVRAEDAKANKVALRSRMSNIAK